VSAGGRTPRVSVCVCAYNDAEHIGRAIESVLAQTFEDFELLVLDDASSDGTVEVAAGYDDRRLRVIRNPVNLGNARNRSRAATLGLGEFIKYVDQDDLISPDCLAEHLRLLEQHPTIGFTFSRRELRFEGEAPVAAQAWRERYGEPQAAFGALGELNGGPMLLDAYVARGFGDNWIGEPTSVMIRTASLRRTGLFNRFVRQAVDMDLWLRLMAFYEVGFLDATLCTRWVTGTGETGPNMSARRGWLDRLWMLEGLSEIPEIWRRYPALAGMRRDAEKSMLVSLATGRYRNRSVAHALAEARRYVAHRTRRRLGSPASVYDVLGP
jgi:glycosyltransferase involved in cell wall biosynthesis